MTKADAPFEELPALTARQLEALEWIYRYWSEHRHAPTQRELSSGLGAVTQTASPWVRVLEERGYVTRWPAKKRRNLRLTEKAVKKLKLEGRIEIGVQKTLFD